MPINYSIFWCEEKLTKYHILDIQFLFSELSHEPIIALSIEISPQGSFLNMSFSKWHCSDSTYRTIGEKKNKEKKYTWSFFPISRKQCSIFIMIYIWLDLNSHTVRLTYTIILSIRFLKKNLMLKYESSD